MMIAMAWAAPLVSALGAIAPSYVFLVGTQALGRPLGLTLDILIAVVAVEEMPRDTRAYATGLLAVVSGIGGGIAVGSLPLADLGPTSWRLIYVIALVWLFVAIALMKWLPESDRFIKNSLQPSAPRLRLKNAFRGNLGRICSVVFLTNLYIASASIFQNRFLKDDRGYSAALIALFTVVTSTPLVSFLGAILLTRKAVVFSVQPLFLSEHYLSRFRLAHQDLPCGGLQWLVALHLESHTRRLPCIAVNCFLRDHVAWRAASL